MATPTASSWFAKHPSLCRARVRLGGAPARRQVMGPWGWPRFFGAKTGASSPAGRLKAVGAAESQPETQRLVTMATTLSHDTIAVVDFGGQYAHLIANKVRRLNVLAEIRQPDDSLDLFRKSVVILGGRTRFVWWSVSWVSVCFIDMF